MKSYLALVIVAVVIAFPARAQSIDDVEKDVVPRPLDYGPGPGVPANTNLRITKQPTVAGPTASCLVASALILEVFSDHRKHGL